MVGLNDFTSIFQLLAALCILFFYDNLLKHVTPTNARENAIKYVDSISTTLQGIDNTLSTKLSRIANNAKIEQFNSLVSHVGKSYFIFLFAILILAANCVDNDSIDYQSSSILRNSRMCLSSFLLSITVSAYSIVVMWCRQRKWCRLYWSFLLIAIFISIFTSYAVSNLYLPILFSITWAHYAVILSFILVIIWIVFTFYYDERRAKLFEADLKRVSDQFQSFANWTLQPNSFKKFSEIDLALKWNINFNDTPESARKIVYPILRKNIMSVLHRHACGYILS